VGEFEKESEEEVATIEAKVTKTRRRQVRYKASSESRGQISLSMKTQDARLHGSSVSVSRSQAREQHSRKDFTQRISREKNPRLSWPSRRPPGKLIYLRTHL
jgi:hypothetical protein